MPCHHLTAQSSKGAKLQNITKAEIKSTLCTSMPIQLLPPLKCNTQGSLHTGDSLLNTGLLSFLKTYYFSAHTVFFSIWTCFWKSPNSHWAPNGSSFFTVKSSENLNSGNGKILSNYHLSYKIHFENFLYKMTNHFMCKWCPTEINEILCLQN